MIDTDAVGLVDADGLMRLEQAAEGLSPSGIAGALIGADVDPGHGLAGVPASKVAVAEGCLIAALRTDTRAAGVAGHLGPLPGNRSEVRAKALALSEARNRGHKAFEEAQAAYNEALTAGARIGAYQPTPVPVEG